MRKIILGMERFLTPVTLGSDHNSVMASGEWVPKDASMQEIILEIGRMLISVTPVVRDQNSSM